LLRQTDFRFSKNARVPSALSTVPQQIPNSAA
jgi:hypothetical protein